MNYILRDLANKDKFKKYINNNTYPMNLSGLAFAAKAQLIATTYEEKRNPICLITYNEIQAKEMIKNLNYFLKESIYFPKKEISAYDYDVESNDIEYARIDVLNKIYEKKAKVIVTTIEAIMQKMIMPSSLYSSALFIKNDDEINIENIKKSLIDLGYTRVDLVENRGEFSIRGDIIDIGIEENEGIRIELWGDTVDSLRRFKLASQRSVDMLKNIKIYPATENILENSLETICNRIENNKKEYSLEDIEIIKEGNYFSKINKYFNEFYIKSTNFLEYIKDFDIFIDEKEKINQRIDAIKKKIKI